VGNKTIHPPDINYQAQLKYGNVQSGKRVKRKKRGQVSHHHQEACLCYSLCTMKDPIISGRPFKLALPYTLSRYRLE